MALKRARLEDKAGAWHHTESNSQGSNCEDAIESFRKYLFTSFAAGELTALQVVAIAEHHTQCGGEGLRDVSVADKTHASRHLKLVLGKSFDEPELSYVDTPI